MIEELRADCKGEVFSYPFLMDHLRSYGNPRGKISRMLRSEQIVRVKKGLYVFGERYRYGPISRPILANLIYGPSYVSGLYALSHHDLIPERVETVTSMTPQRNRNFTTPFGHFEYIHLSKQRYSIGIDWLSFGEEKRCLFASPEKALVDITFRQNDLGTEKEMKVFLLDDLRLDEEELDNLDRKRLEKIVIAYRSPVIQLLLRSI